MQQRAVIALGGNALIKDESRCSIDDQLAAVQEMAGHISDFIELGYEVVLTHGNGPQVGFILRRSELAFEAGELHFVPLKNCVANTQGAIGYQIQESLVNAFGRRKIDKTPVSLVTLVEVDRNDPSFARPVKPIGVYYQREKAESLAQEHPDWHLVHQAGKGYRRVVPSPRPLRIIEMDAIGALADAGFVVVAAGGGGIPVIRDDDGELQGVNAVVDKDLTASLLATGWGAQVLIITTTVENVCLDFGSPAARPLTQISVEEAKEYIAQGQFEKGSMLPKIEAAVDFLSRGGERVVITSPENLMRALEDGSGTQIVP
ncbi:MAG: carbamate kinase [Desulfofustis sp.]|jgi:carbamate kinase